MSDVQKGLNAALDEKCFDTLLLDLSSLMCLIEISVCLYLLHAGKEEDEYKSSRKRHEHRSCNNVVVVQLSAVRAPLSRGLNWRRLKTRADR